MASLEQLQMRKAAAKTQLVKNGTDTPVAIRIRNKAGKAVTSVAVTTGTSLVLTDSVGATTSTFATDSTVAKVLATVNGSADWEAKALDILLSDVTTDNIFVTNAGITAQQDGNGNTYYDVLVSTAVSLEIAACVSPFRDFDAPKGHRVVIKNIKYGVNMGTAAVDSAQLYKRKDGVETKVFGELSVDTTETTVMDYLSSPDGFYGDSDTEYIFRVKDAATLSDATTNYVRVIANIE